MITVLYSSRDLAIVSRQGRALRQGRDGPTRRDYNRDRLWSCEDSGVELFAELSWLDWDAELCCGHDEQSYGVSDRVVLPYRASCSFASALPLVGETSQQRQGTRRAKETGR
ncbi:hypothetical protein Taro_015569 [Colocasia esculenta]|uniref:Uncharacterized protein n=1 Tax=Colocasia esculenta TaxID=4460 RepID=A0A843ULK9_COLES|nr:hypothetical protein [Colocasia esculenta]